MSGPARTRRVGSCAALLLAALAVAGTARAGGWQQTGTIRARLDGRAMTFHTFARVQSGRRVDSARLDGMTTRNGGRVVRTAVVHLTAYAGRDPLDRNHPGALVVELQLSGNPYRLDPGSVTLTWYPQGRVTGRAFPGERAEAKVRIERVDAEHLHLTGRFHGILKGYARSAGGAHAMPVSGRLDIPRLVRGE
ncbi:MAG TPA: hypothetical protein VFA86_00335 [Gammaproteobacteria bacterium]|nr:hypothetical protein [Gammaproteobacteria bacterium]